MRLRNKKTGQEGNFIINKDHFECTDLEYVPEYRSLAELNEEWKDYEEPEKYFWIDVDGFIVSNDISTKDAAFETFKQNLKSIGNYFETKEEAKKAVEKLKAFKRLKDKGFKFDGEEVFSEGLLEIDAVLPALEKADNAERLKIVDDLWLLFGGEEE